MVLSRTTLNFDTILLCWICNHWQLWAKEECNDEILILMVKFVQGRVDSLNVLMLKKHSQTQRFSTATFCVYHELILPMFREHSGTTINFNIFKISKMTQSYYIYTHAVLISRRSFFIAKLLCLLSFSFCSRRYTKWPKRRPKTCSFFISTGTLFPGKRENILLLVVDKQGVDAELWRRNNE